MLSSIIHLLSYHLFDEEARSKSLGSGKENKQHFPKSRFNYLTVVLSSCHWHTISPTHLKNLRYTLVVTKAELTRTLVSYRIRPREHWLRVRAISLVSSSPCSCIITACTKQQGKGFAVFRIELSTPPVYVQQNACSTQQHRYQQAPTNNDNNSGTTITTITTTTTNNNSN